MIISAIFLAVNGFVLSFFPNEISVLITNNDKYCEKMQMIRNHAEAIVKNKKVESISNMIGYNFRMGEIEAAIGIEQLKKLRTFLDKRQIAANYLTAGLKTLDG